MLQIVEELTSGTARLSWWNVRWSNPNRMGEMVGAWGPNPGSCRLSLVGNEQMIGMRYSSENHDDDWYLETKLDDFLTSWRILVYLLIIWLCVLITSCDYCSSCFVSGFQISRAYKTTLHEWLLLWRRKACFPHLYLDTCSKHQDNKSSRHVFVRQTYMSHGSLSRYSWFWIQFR